MPLYTQIAPSSANRIDVIKAKELRKHL